MTAIHANVTIPKNHRLRLDLDVPAEIPAGKAEVTVTVSPLRKPNKARAIECLRALSRAGGIAAIPDPAAWQREVRRDRKLPGRD